MTYEPVDMSYAFSSSHNPLQANMVRQAELRFLDSESALLRSLSDKLLAAYQNKSWLDVWEIYNLVPKVKNKPPHCFYCKDYVLCEHNKDTHIGRQQGSMATIT